MGVTMEKKKTEKKFHKKVKSLWRDSSHISGLSRLQNLHRVITLSSENISGMGEQMMI